MGQKEGFQESHTPGHRKAGNNDFGKKCLGLDSASSSYLRYILFNNEFGQEAGQFCVYKHCLVQKHIDY